MDLQVRCVTKTLRIMRLTAIILLAGSVTVSAHTYSQISLSAKDAPLTKVFKEIQQQTGYDFLFSADLVEHAGTVTLQLTNVSLQRALEECLKGKNLAYEIQEKTIVIKKSDALSAETKNNLPPPIDVHGRITNESNEPLEGVNITVKGSKSGTVTDVDGAFTLRNVDGNATIIISFVGYEQQYIRIANHTALVIKLRQGAESLKDVVVSKGYYDSKQEYNTGNVYKVEGKDLQKQPVTDPLLALEGRVPGLSIQQVSGVPGAYSVIRLRGQNAIQFGKPITANDPLYIVDGTPFSSQSLTNEFVGGGIFNAPKANSGPGYLLGAGQGMSPFNSLNPADIESIEILKDADATAIYGSRGANGVILITTKKGRKGQNKLDVNVYTGTSKVTRYLKLLNTQQYLEMEREAFNNDGLGFLLDPQYAEYFPSLLFWDTTRYTDWQKELMDRSNNFSNAQINFSGGNNNVQFFVGGGYSRQGALFPGNYADRKISTHAALTAASPNTRLHMSLSINYTNDFSNMPGASPTNSITLPPDAPPLYDSHGNLNWAPYGGTATWTNPLSGTYAHANAVSEYYAENLNVRYTLFKGLDIGGNAGYSTQRLDQQNLAPSASAPPPLNTNPMYRTSTFSENSSKTWNLEPQLSYSRTVGKGTLDLLIGSTFLQTVRDSKAELGNGYASDVLITNIQAASVVRIMGVSNAEYRYNGLYGNIRYNWDGKYILNFTGRRDGSSRFGPNRQFGNFGAFGAAWLFSKEKWITNLLPFLSTGKLRASYGVTGNDQIGDYQFMSTYSPNTTAGGIQNVTGLQPTLMPNPYFEWERVRKLEEGVEIGLFKDAVFFTVSHYRNRTDNQLVGYQLPQLTGFGVVEANFPALIQNTGWEFTLHTRNITTKDFSWTSDFNLSISRDKLISFPGIENTPYFYLLRVGQSQSSQLLFKYIGVDPQTGEYKFQTKNESGSPSAPDDWYPTKPLTPLYFAGLGNSLHFKQFQIDFWIQCVNQSGYTNTPFFGAPGASEINQPQEVMERWQKPGDVKNVQRFSITNSTSAFNNFVLSDGVITNASYIRLKNISVSYSLPTTVLSKIHFISARLYVQCQNLFTITKYPGLDPESQGLNLPPLRTITGGLQFSL